MIEAARTALGFSRSEVARALPSEKPGRAHRNVSTISHNCCRGAELREHPDVALLMAEVMRSEALPPGAARRARAAFQAAWAAASRRDGARLGLEAIQDAFAAAARAQPIRLASKSAPAPKPRTAVPEFDDRDPGPVRAIRDAPAFRDVASSLTWAKSGETGVVIEFLVAAEKEAQALIQRGAKFLALAGWRAEQWRAVKRDRGRFRCALHAIAAALAALALIPEGSAPESLQPAQAGRI